MASGSLNSGRCGNCGPETRWEPKRFYEEDPRNIAKTTMHFVARASDDGERLSPKDLLEWTIKLVAERAPGTPTLDFRKVADDLSRLHVMFKRSSRAADSDPDEAKAKSKATAPRPAPRVDPLSVESDPNEPKAQRVPLEAQELEKRDREEMAALYYKRVIREYPNSAAADTARERMAELDKTKPKP